MEQLVKMVIHPFPKVRWCAVEEVFVRRGGGKGVDWGKAKKGEIEALREEIKDLGRVDG